MPKKIDKQKAKKVIEQTATKTVKFTKTIFLSIFVVMIICTIAFSVYQFMSQDLNIFLEGVATLSIGGFWAFFLGYFGWRMGETVEHYLISMRKK